MASRKTNEQLRSLLNVGNTLLQQQDYQNIAHTVFSWGNADGTGWTDEIQRLFLHPVTKREKELAAEIRTLLQQTIEGLFPLLCIGGTFMRYVELAKFVDLLILLNAPDFLEKWGQPTRALLLASQELAETEKLRSVFAGAIANLDVHLMTLVSDV